MRRSRKTKQRGRGAWFSRPVPVQRTLFDVIREDGEVNMNNDENVEQYEEGKSNEIRALIQAGANINAKDENGFTPLIALIMATNLYGGGSDFYRDIIRDLIGDDINYMAADGSALHYAVSASQSEYINFLLNNGANIDLRNIRGETPLFMACARSYFTVASTLSIRGANVNTPDNQGRTPAQVIGIYGGNAFINRLILEVLCDHGANDVRCNEILRQQAQQEAQAAAQEYLDSYDLPLTLDVINQGLKDIPIDRQQNMITAVDFIEGEDIIVITENGFEFIYKVAPLQLWFDTRRSSGHIITNPATNNRIINQYQISRWSARVPVPKNNKKKSRKTRKN